MKITIDFESFNPTINDIAIELAMVLFIPLFLASFIKVIYFLCTMYLILLFKPICSHKITCI
ncbi:hypothetical protein [Bacillus cereus]|uniref:hypothetical protein n=1 Tax=Bacillus cereus TaxID=1396 RepID=UPI0009B1BE90